MQNNKVYIIGVMSGTSLDGLDLVYVSFDNVNTADFEIISAETIPYTEYWYSTLKGGFNKTYSELKELDVEYGIYIGREVNKFREKNNIEKIDLIASHGHTIFHKPDEGYTLQIGDGKTISQEVGVTTVCDFRTQDVDYGGQGAPLVPVGDVLLFSEYTYCLNLGGFANISFEGNQGVRLAYDICPVNIVMNHYCQKLGFAYDDNGAIARKGFIHEELLDSLNTIPYYNMPLPKSLGYEFVVAEIFPLIDAFDLSVQDVLRTFIAHIAQQISKSFGTDGQVLITGGGAYNGFLIEELKKKTNCKVVVPDHYTVDFKEALIFALLGLLRVNGQVNCLASVTGAKKDHSSGKICTLN